MGGTPDTTVTAPDLREAVYEEWDSEGELQKFIAADVLPRADVDLADANFKKIDREQYLKDVDTERGKDGGYANTGWEYVQDSYATREYGLIIPVDHNRATVNRTFFDSERITTKIILSKLWRDWEKIVAAQMFSAANFTGFNTSAAVVWSANASATPILDLRTANRQVLLQCGLKPNTIIMNKLGFDELIETDEVKELLKYSGHQDPKTILPADVARLLEVDRVLVAEAIVDNADPGLAGSNAFLWADRFALTAFIRPSPGDFRAQIGAEASLGYTINWEADGGQWDYNVERWVDQDTRRTRIRGRRQVVNKVLNFECGHLVTST